MSKRGYHHGDLDRAVITEGLAALDELGVEGVGASEIARRAGVTHAAVYKRFGARPALLEALAASCNDGLRDAMLGAVNRAGDVPRDQFLAGGWAVARYAWKHPHRYQLMFAGPATKRPEELAATPSEAPFGALIGLVERWQAAGLLRSGEPFPIALSIFATTNGVAMLFASGRLELSARSAKALADRVHQDLLDGLAP